MTALSDLNSWLIAAGVVVAIVFVVAVFLRLDSHYERKEQRAFARSVLVRDRITRELNETEARLASYELGNHDTLEVRELHRAIANIRAASRDGRRDTAYIERLNNTLPALEDKALASIKA